MEGEKLPPRPEKEKAPYKLRIKEVRSPEPEDNNKLETLIVTAASKKDWDLFERVEPLYPLQDAAIFHVQSFRPEEQVRNGANELYEHISKAEVQEKLLDLADQYNELRKQLYELDDQDEEEGLGIQAHMEVLKGEAKVLMEGEDDDN